MILIDFGRTGNGPLPFCCRQQPNVLCQEVIATTECGTDPLQHRQMLQEMGLTSRICTTCKPFDVTDAEALLSPATWRSLTRV